ncbi:MAG TPA: LysR family transcriptional regulator [Ktedonobacteraceae bacterium]|nr:LysR family transcriptional regulator [Ktedonobacteraceae bacterium]
MNFNHLLIFQKVAKKGHFTRAAEELFISQPAVSKQIHELEKALKQPLFSRVGQKVFLTDAGRLLLPYANRIFALAEEAEMALQEMQGLERGQLTVGASMTIGTYLLPELLGVYKERHPRIELFVTVANTEEVQEAVLVNKVEIGLIEGGVTHPELEQQVWRQDELVRIGSPEKARDLPEEMSIEQFLALRLPLIMCERGSGTRSVLEEALLAFEVTPTLPVMELNSPEAIKRAVVAGLGYAFVSEQTITHEEAAQRLQRIPLKGFQVRRPLLVIIPRQKKFSKTTEAFLKLLQETS